MNESISTNNHLNLILFFAEVYHSEVLEYKVVWTFF